MRPIGEGPNAGGSGLPSASRETLPTSRHVPVRSRMPIPFLAPPESTAAGRA